MKRFFIFATMLMAWTVSADNLPDDPPPTTPSPDTIILIPQDMFDIDRTIALCEYTYDVTAGAVYVICYGTGRNTELYLISQTGAVVDFVVIDSDITQDTSLSLPDVSGTYKIVLYSEKYYGEDTFTIE